MKLILLLLFTTLASAKTTIVSSTLMIYDAVKVITADALDANLEYIMGPGVDPHLYQPSTGDLRKLKNADLIFYNGLHLEGKMHEIFESLKKQKKVFALSDTIPKSSLITSNDLPDPHVWFDPNIWVLGVEGVLKSLSENFPEKSKNFESNFKAWKQEVLNVHTFGKNEIQKIPKTTRILITSHDAFQYFGRAFMIEVKGIQGISTSSEAGMKDIANIIELIKERKVKAIFIESSVPPATIEKVQHESKTKIGGELFSDSMGKLGTPEGSYLGMLKKNIEIITSSLK